MRISDWSSDVCSSDLRAIEIKAGNARAMHAFDQHLHGAVRQLEHLQDAGQHADAVKVFLARFVGNSGFLRNQQDVLVVLHRHGQRLDRSEEHTSELPSLMRISYAVLCLKKKNKN